LGTTGRGGRLPMPLGWTFCGVDAELLAVGAN